MPAIKENSKVLHHWSARKIHPSVLIYVVIIYFALIAIVYFGFNSRKVVITLAATLAGIILPLLPGVLKRIEYKLTAQTLEQRPLTPENTTEYKEVFKLNQLDHIVKIKHGFKFYLTIDEQKPFKLFWKKHLSDKFSGEVHVESGDIDRVIETVTKHGIASR